MIFSVLILTKNEEQDLPGCLKSVSWCDDIHVLDSLSADRTPEIAKAAGAMVTSRAFDNWASHQNWALDNLPFKHSWVLYLDADERISPELQQTLVALESPGADLAAFEIRRRDFAWNGKWLKYSQVSPFYLRLFRPAKMRYERLVNPVSIPNGPTGRLAGFIDHYPFSKGFNAWLRRHIGYAEFEAEMRASESENTNRLSLRTAFFGRNFTEKRIHQKRLFYHLPCRPLVKWLYMVIWRRGFLDGSTGLTYATLQSVYEYFIVIRTRELLRNLH